MVPESWMKDMYHIHVYICCVVDLPNAQHLLSDEVFRYVSLYEVCLNLCFHPYPCEVCLVNE